MKNTIEFRVANIRQQFRFPRSKKRRIQRKWRNDPKNSRPLTGKIWQITSTNELVCTPDMVPTVEATIREVIRAEIPEIDEEDRFFRFNQKPPNRTPLPEMESVYREPPLRIRTKPKPTEPQSNA